VINDSFLCLIIRLINRCSPQGMIIAIVGDGIHPIRVICCGMNVIEIHKDRDLTGQGVELEKLFLESKSGRKNRDKRSGHEIYVTRGVQCIGTKMPILLPLSGVERLGKLRPIMHRNTGIAFLAQIDYDRLRDTHPLQKLRQSGTPSAGYKRTNRRRLYGNGPIWVLFGAHDPKSCPTHQ